MHPRPMHQEPYFVTSVTRNESELRPDTFPGNLPFINGLHYDVTAPVTFFVGENGSGKSTLLEAMAVLSRLSISGGGLNEAGSDYGLNERSLLAEAIRIAFKRQPKDRYFFRAETQAHFATLLNTRQADPLFEGDAYRRYGGKSLLHMSHGEAFLSVMQHRFHEGLFFMDEPESALSPQRQLTLLALIHKLVRGGQSQFFIATHSPILLTFPGATILSFDSDSLTEIELEDTSHYQITRDFLNNPAMYWKHLASHENDAER